MQRVIASRAVWRRPVGRATNLNETGESMPVRKLTRTLWRPAIALAVLAAWFAIGGCTLHDYPQSTLNPRSDYAQSIQDLLEKLTFWVVVIFALVMGLLMYAVVRFRARPGAPDPKPIHGNTALEIAWTIAPALILAAVAVPTVLTIFKTQGTPPADAITIEAIGHQWWWEFKYPTYGFTTGSEMHVPVGKPIHVEVESADVLHSFWFPAMGGKRDAVPTHINHVMFTADSTGVFLGQCAELCGLQHANMHMKLFVEPQTDFDAWVAGQKAPPLVPTDTTTVAWQGRKTFSESGCIACHTITDISEGIIGPNLNHVGSRTSLAGAMLPNDTEHMTRWITEPDKQKPGTLMLNLGLPPEQVSAIVAYLQTLK